MRTACDRTTWDDLPDFISPPDLARVLGINVVTAYEITRRADFVCLRINRKVIIPKAAAMRYFAPEQNRQPIEVPTPRQKRQGKR